MIDYERLLFNIKESIEDKEHNKYDFNTILKSASLCWDGTAIMVTSSDFTMVFDLISYELVNYEGLDIR